MSRQDRKRNDSTRTSLHDDPVAFRGVTKTFLLVVLGESLLLLWNFSVDLKNHTQEKNVFYDPRKIPKKGVPSDTKILRYSIFIVFYFWRLAKVSGSRQTVTLLILRHSSRLPQFCVFLYVITEIVAVDKDSVLQCTVETLWNPIFVYVYSLQGRRVETLVPNNLLGVGRAHWLSFDRSSFG